MTANEKIKFNSLEQLGERQPRRYTKEELEDIINDPEKLKEAVAKNRLAFLMDLFRTLSANPAMREKVFEAEKKRR